MAAHHRSLLALAWTRTATESPLIPPPMRALGHRNCACVSYGPHVLTQCLGQMSALALAWWAQGVRGRWRRWGGAAGSAGALMSTHMHCHTDSMHSQRRAQSDPFRMCLRAG